MRGNIFAVGIAIGILIGYALGKADGDEDCAAATATESFADVGVSLWRGYDTTTR